MNHSYHPLQKRLVEQLAFIDEHRYTFLDTYFPSNLLERSKVDKFFDQYVQEVESFLSTFNAGPTSIMSRVFIGSKVLLFYEQGQETDSFTLCFPEKANPDSGYISFLSPVGWQLILRSTNEAFTLNTPNGKTDVVIQKIEFNDW
ncbi:MULTISPECIES: GreA/GreB family elongation factor [Aneurinibacillus]|uniref:GreA/GreB family elongation factor n=1 Tax=Aneurinibacillus thermoaerophilus TaxID=143495 RepID=A0A1G7WSC4_ANETH|nr:MULTISPECIES: GreA/GreB family elongation factor [Aneurinibacillus]AMA73984.1 hypothetical protein ACH33_14830 [Aneurinibacillus sp. XH2]MED0676239.1 GreA/GreB family elongation factor [Aneurinibacillus thermoaerophilus]MED0678171.1 GreA/GreB family elongation factor [Aneurinibacillus thermoaerophilus]MED0737643.1 GreA/GreB family elongation factor [Aneurinibacillus thermoaerophilus]MED0755635.1 GreA/GreB family elongation factor [Aneurinibacillus thermoaerophilus]